MPSMALETPLLRRRDLTMGKLLGRGRYSQVHEVVLECDKGEVWGRLTAATAAMGIHTDDNPAKDTAGAKEVGAKGVPNVNNNGKHEALRKDQPSSTQPKQRQYVMKHLSHNLFSNRGQRRFAKDVTNALADLVLEAMYLSKLRHPNIIRLRALTLGGTAVLKRQDALAEDYFLVLDRMDQTLDHRIQDWRVAAPTAASNNTRLQTNATMANVLIKTQYALQIANALSYLHDHQIIYRDLKPENIGLLKTVPPTASNVANKTAVVVDTIQLFDFGLARELDEPVDVNPSADNVNKDSIRLYDLSASGTRRYMAPEVFNPPGKYSYMADVYSFAMVYFEMLALLKPFADFTCQSHDELVYRLGGRPKLSDITWPHSQGIQQHDDAHTASSQAMAQEIEKLLHQTWKQNFYLRPSIHQVCQRIGDLLNTYGGDYVFHQNQSDISQEDTDVATTASGSSLQWHFQAQINQQRNSYCSQDDISDFFRKKTSNSDVTVATDAMASDCSEVDDLCDIQHQMLSQGSK